MKNFFAGAMAPTIAALALGLASPATSDTIVPSDFYYTQTFVSGTLFDPDGTVNDPPGTIQEPIDDAPVSNLDVDVNGATNLFDTGRFSSPRGVSSSANLETGELGVQSQSSYSGVAGSAAFSSSTTARFGDTLTFEGPIDSEVTLDFAVDGIINAPGPLPDLGSNSFILADFYIALYSGSSADENSWDDVFFGGGGPTPLATDRFTLNLTNDPNPSTIIDEVLSVSTTLTQTVEEFQIFAHMSAFSSRNQNPGTTDVDLSNTGTFSLFVDPGVSVSSASGVFPDAITPPDLGVVPLPASAWLLLAGLGGLFGLRRRADG